MLCKMLLVFHNSLNTDINTQIVTVFHIYPGNTEFIETDYDAMSSVLSECTEPQPTSCNKDTGAKQRLQKWSRGHLFIVRGGGIIDRWNPLFK